MPSLRTLSPTETAALEQPPIGARAQVAREYDASLADVAIGDDGRAELQDDERRAVVRPRLHAAARRRGLALRFRPGPSTAMIFHVAATAPVARPALPPAPPPPPERIPESQRSSGPAVAARLPGPGLEQRRDRALAPLRRVRLLTADRQHADLRPGPGGAAGRAAPACRPLLPLCCC